MRVLSVLFLSAWMLMLSVSRIATSNAQEQTPTEDCPVLAQRAMEAVQQVCAATRRDQICYGNINIDASPSSSAVDFVFEKQGDLANVADIATLQLRSLDLNSQEWGVALAKLQASLPDDSTENVSMLLFGNIAIANQSVEPVTLPMTTNGNANVRVGPGSTGLPIGVLAENSAVIANGRIKNLAGEEWIRIEFADGPGGMGWLLSPVLDTEGDRSSLVELSSAAAPAFGPMQAFTFSSGSDDRPCETAPDSGIMIQTPDGVGEITFLINEVEFRIGSTTYIQAHPGDTMNINTLEGHVIVSANGETRLVPPGTAANVPLDEFGAAGGPPSLPVPYDETRIFRLSYPLDANLFDEVFEFDEALDEVFLDEFNDFFNDGDGDLLDEAFIPFIEAFLDEDFGEVNFDTDLADELVEYVEQAAANGALQDEFLTEVFRQFDDELRAEFTAALGESDLADSVEESIIEVYEEVAADDETPGDDEAGDTGDDGNDGNDGTDENEDGQDHQDDPEDQGGGDDLGDDAPTEDPSEEANELPTEEPIQEPTPQPEEPTSEPPQEPTSEPPTEEPMPEPTDEGGGDSDDGGCEDCP